MWICTWTWKARVEDSKSTPKLNKNGLFFFLMTSLHFFNRKIFPQQFSGNTTAAPASPSSKGIHILGWPLEQQTRLPRVPHYLSTGHIHQRADKEGHSMNYFHRSLPASDRLLLHLWFSVSQANRSGGGFHVQQWRVLPPSEHEAAGLHFSVTLVRQGRRLMHEAGMLQSVPSKPFSEGELAACAGSWQNSFCYLLKYTLKRHS